MKNDLFSPPFLLLQNCLAQKFHQTLDACVVNQKYSATRSLRASSSGAPGDTREYPGGGEEELARGLRAAEDIVFEIASMKHSPHV